jgi:diaminohydroxyphosphoribosylaminopyrimidine deaminase/5-amino-6-(5-phosphoribosylamino)uracil reductase
VDELAHPGCRGLLDDYRAATADVLPWTVAKWAMSLDGRTADARGASRWISGEAAREVSHRLRASCDAIVVGARTAALDDPDLRPRIEGYTGPVPLRVVVDGALRLTHESVLARTAREGPVLVATRACPAGAQSAALLDAGVELLSLPAADRGVDLLALFTELRRRGVRRVLLEGGGEIAAAAFRARLVRQVAVFIAPMVLGGASAPLPVAGEAPISLVDAPLVLRVRRTSQVGDDLFVEGLLPRVVSAS